MAEQHHIVLPSSVKKVKLGITVTFHDVTLTIPKLELQYSLSFRRKKVTKNVIWKAGSWFR